MRGLRVTTCAVLATVLPASLAFNPKDSSHCLRWISHGAASVIRAEGAYGRPHADDPVLCRHPRHPTGQRANVGGDFADTCLPDPHQEAAIGERSRHLAVGTLVDAPGATTHKACVPLRLGRMPGAATVASLGPPDDVEVAVVDPTCEVWWREVTADVIPPIPELVLPFGTTTIGDKVGLCRTFGDRADVDGFRRLVGTIVLEGVDFGQCFFTRNDGSTGQLNGGTFHVLQARAAAPSCLEDSALAAELSTGLRQRLSSFLVAEDRVTIERVARSTFAELEQAALSLGSCELKQVLSPARFVPSPLNTLGLHLLRALLAERMADARAGAQGLGSDPHYLVWKRDGILVKDFDEVGDGGLHRLLQVASGESVEAIPLPPYRWTPRDVTVTAEHDPQNEWHIDTFASIVKVWLFDPSVTVDEGPLEYVFGSHRETEPRLRWMHAYSLPPAKEALLEPSFRLEGNLAAVAAAPDFHTHCRESSKPILPLPGVKRTLVIADTSGLHRRAPGLVGHTRRSWRLAGDNDGGLKRLDPYRLLAPLAQIPAPGARAPSEL